ncbi:MAG: hypothetical protein LBK66_00560 [Spirochaetaceae bacterium]|jgi:hypothetical protein|nr:hypothetical protein [Spirochaetaceae bacterium]
MRKIHFIGLPAMMLVLGLTLSVCDHNPRNDGGGDEDPNVTDKVVDASKNEANLMFLATPDTPEFAEQIKTAHDNGFTWSMDLVQKDGTYTKTITSQTNQLSAAGSGFEFSLNTSAADKDKLRPAIGFGSMFYFTADDGNLGSDAYNSLKTELDKLPNYEGWVFPDATVLTNLGIRVYTMYESVAQDITNRVSFGMMVGDSNILIYYGAVMVDREYISGFSNEGKPLLVSDEEELIWSDGTLDGKITCAWWIGKTGS